MCKTNEREKIRKYLNKKVHGKGKIYDVKYIKTTNKEMLFSVLLKDVLIEKENLSHQWALYIKDFKNLNISLHDEIEFDSLITEYRNSEEKIGIFELENVNIIKKSNKTLNNLIEIKCLGLYDTNKKLSSGKELLELKNKFLAKYNNDFVNLSFNLEINSRKSKNVLVLKFKYVIFNNKQLIFSFYPSFKNCIILNEQYLIKITNASYQKLLNLYFFTKYQEIKFIRTGFLENTPFSINCINLLESNSINKNIENNKQKGNKNMEFTKKMNYEELIEVIKNLNPFYEENIIKIDNNPYFNSNILEKNLIKDYEGLYEEIFEECKEKYEKEFKEKEYKENYEKTKSCILNLNPTCIGTKKSYCGEYFYDYIELDDNEKFGNKLLKEDLKNFKNLFEEIEKIALEKAIDKENKEKYQEEISEYINIHEIYKKKAFDCNIDLNLFLIERMIEEIKKCH